MIETKSLKRPIVMYNATTDCTMGCTHCYNGSGRDGYTPPVEVLYADVDRLARVAGAINFTGGEPFLVPSLPGLLTMSAAQSTDNIITTNGIRLTEPDADHLLASIEPHLYMLKIGMMGYDQRTNDFVRGTGHFDVAVKALDLMAGYDFVSCIKISVDSRTADNLEGFCTFALEHGVDQIVFGQLIQIGRAGDYMREFVLSQDDMARANDVLQRLRERYQDGIKIARHCTLSGLCQEPGHFYTVTVDGAMSPCLMREDLAVGNIRTDDVKALFETVDDMRETVKTHPSVRDLEVAGCSCEAEKLAII